METAELILSLTAGEQAIVNALRSTILNTVPEVHESVIWGSLSYHLPKVGGRIKGSVCLISLKRGKVLLEFIHGVRLPDPHGLLKGDAASKRFVEIASPEEAARPEIASLIRNAAQVKWD